MTNKEDQPFEYANVYAAVYNLERFSGRIIISSIRPEHIRDENAAVGTVTNAH